MQRAAEPLVAQIELGDSAQLVGDIGLIAVKAILEHGMGYVVTGWTEADHPIAAAIDACRTSVFSRRGILLRRLRNVDAVAATILEPGSSAFGSDTPMRGMVVWNGRSGTRPALERLLSLSVPGPVVVLCEDPDVVRIADAVVLDPAPTPQSFIGAIDAAVEISGRSGRPVGVLLRPAMLDMRGSHACRDNMSVMEVARLDAVRTHDAGSIGEIVEKVGLNAVARGNLSAQDAPVVLAPAAAVRAIIAGIDFLVRDLVDRNHNAAAAAIRDTVVVCQDVPSIVTSATMKLMEAAASVLVLDATRSTARFSRSVVDGREIVYRGIAVEQIDVRSAARLIGAHFADTTFTERYPEAAQVIAAKVEDTSHAHVMSRIPRRGAGISGPVPDRLAVALTLAQADLGVPARISDHHPSYVTRSGGAITVVSAERLGVEGAACAAPQAQHGTFIVYGTMSPAVQAACSAMGATIELVSEVHPRQIAGAISRSVASITPQPRVVVVVGGSFAPIDPTVVVGCDRELIRVERLSSVTMPEHALGLREHHDDALASGVAVTAVDVRAVQVGLGAAQEMSSGWYSIRRHSGRTLSRWSQMTWSVRRRIVRTLGGVDL